MRKKDPQDANTIGQILLTYGLTPLQLSEAVQFRRDNGDIFLGEACVRLDFITRATLDAAIKKQAASEGSGAKMIQLATERTKRTSVSVVNLAAASLALADSLK